MRRERTLFCCLSIKSQRDKMYTILITNSPPLALPPLPLPHSRLRQVRERCLYPCPCPCGPHLLIQAHSAQPVVPLRDALSSSLRGREWKRGEGRREREREGGGLAHGRTRRACRTCAAHSAHSTHLPPRDRRHRLLSPFQGSRLGPVGFRTLPVER